MVNVHAEGRAESLLLGSLGLCCRGTPRTRQRLSRGYKVMTLVLVLASNRPAHAAGPGNTPLLDVTIRFGRRGLPRVRVRWRPARDRPEGVSGVQVQRRHGGERVVRRVECALTSTSSSTSCRWVCIPSDMAALSLSIICLNSWMRRGT